MDKQIYLPEYFSGRIAASLQQEQNDEILIWDFTKNVSDQVKIQIEVLLNHIVKTVKDRSERYYKYLLPLKYLFQYAEETGLQDILKMEMTQEKEYALLLKRNTQPVCNSPIKFIRFCREVLFLQRKEIDWAANVWFVEKMNIAPQRGSLGNTIRSFSFLDIKCLENRTIFQQYIKYLLTITALNLGTIKIHFGYIKGLLKHLEAQSIALTSLNRQIMHQYFVQLQSQDIAPQSYNNKFRSILDFLGYLRVNNVIGGFEIPVNLYLKKAYPAHNEIGDLPDKLDILMEHLPQFPEHLRIMCLILICTGIDKGRMFLLQNADFYWDNDENWMRIPGADRIIPISVLLHWIVLTYAERNKIPPDCYLFLTDSGKPYTSGAFQKEIMRQCALQHILIDEYVFKGNGYKKEIGKLFFKEGVPAQSIREYFGYETDKLAKKCLGIADEEAIQKAKEYFEQEKSSLGGKVLMAKYDKMRKLNQLESQRKMERAIAEILKLKEEGGYISVSDLAERTGLSKGFFYKNESVRKVLDEVKQGQIEEQITVIRKAVKQKSLEKQVYLYKTEIVKLESENERLRKENKKLQTALAKQHLEYLNLLSEYT